LSIDRLYSYCLIVLALLPLTSCATIGPPSASDEEAIRHGQKTIVILRVSADLDGKPMDAAKHLVTRIASVDAGEPLSPVFWVASPSAELRKKGWIYLLARPGETYYLSFGLGMRETDSLPFPVSPHFWLHVPDNAPLVYVGSLSVSCNGRVDFFGLHYVKECRSLSVSDESESARTALGEWSSQYGPLTTVLMNSSDSPKQVFDPARAQDLAPVGVAASARKEMTSPEWQKRALGYATGLGFIDADTAKAIASFGGGGYPAGAAGAGLVMGYLMYLPIGTALGAIGGVHSLKKWQPCIERLGGQLRESDPETELNRALLTTLRKGGISDAVEIPIDKETTEKARQKGIKSIVKADVESVELKECFTRWTFAVDVAVRVRLWETTTGNYIYDRVFRTFVPDKDRYPYQSHIRLSECRKIEEYCSDEGCNILKEELSRALVLSVEEAARDLGVKVE
jgi:hypothetical protein